MSLRTLIDSPLSWAVVGFVIGATLGVTLVSTSLVVIGLGAFLMYLKMHGPAKRESEGRLFASGPTFMMTWLLGFVVHGLLS